MFADNIFPLFAWIMYFYYTGTPHGMRLACDEKKCRHDFIFVGKSSNFAASTKKTGITPHNQSA